MKIPMCDNVKIKSWFQSRVVSAGNNNSRTTEEKKRINNNNVNEFKIIAQIRDITFKFCYGLKLTKY